LELLTDQKSLIVNDSIHILAKKPITKGHAVGALIEFSNQRNSQTEKIVFASDFDLNNANFTFKLYNKVQLDVFYEIRQELLDFLRKKLENSEILCEAFVATEETKAKPRTEQEKFEAMSIKNPNIWKLKEALDLDLLF